LNIEATARRAHASEGTRSVVNRPRAQDSVTGFGCGPGFSPDQHFCGPQRPLKLLGRRFERHRPTESLSDSYAPSTQSVSAGC
jgi:hypothetical protein